MESENDSQDEAMLLRSEIEAQKPKSKKLVSGDFFGELAFIYNCRRTSMIKARLYSTLGCIDADTTLSLLHEFPDFKSHMKHDIVNVYDDDIKLFLLETLSKVDYLSKVKKEILVNIAYVCNAETKEKGSILYNMDEEVDEQIKDEMIIIFDGQIELYMIMDIGTELMIEILPAGSILNPHNMLAQRKHSINARFSTNTTFFYLKYAKLVEVARKHQSTFGNELLKQIGKA